MFALANGREIKLPRPPRDPLASSHVLVMSFIRTATSGEVLGGLSHFVCCEFVFLCFGRLRRWVNIHRDCCTQRSFVSQRCRFLGRVTKVAGGEPASLFSPLSFSRCVSPAAFTMPEIASLRPGRLLIPSATSWQCRRESLPLTWGDRQARPDRLRPRLFDDIAAARWRRRRCLWRCEGSLRFFDDLLEIVSSAALRCNCSMGGCTATREHRDSSFWRGISERLPRILQRFLWIWYSLPFLKIPVWNCPSRFDEFWRMLGIPTLLNQYLWISWMVFLFTIYKGSAE